MQFTIILYNILIIKIKSITYKTPTHTHTYKTLENFKYNNVYLPVFNQFYTVHKIQFPISEQFCFLFQFQWKPNIYIHIYIINTYLYIKYTVGVPNTMYEKQLKSN